MSEKDTTGRGRERRRRNRQTGFQRNRRILLLSGLGLIAISTGIYAAAQCTPELSNEEIIKREANRLNIKPDPTEQALWKDAYQHPLEKRELSDQALMAVVEPRFRNVMDRMKQSKNPYFANASKDISTHINAGSLSIEWSRRLQHADGLGIGTMGIGMKMNGERLGMVMAIAAESMLNETSALTLAGIIAHEDEHLKRLKAAIQELGSITDAEKYRLLTEKQKDKSYMIQEEAFAHAIDGAAYTYQTGLLGNLYDVTFTGQDNRAAELIRSGNNPQSERWLKYIGTIL